MATEAEGDLIRPQSFHRAELRGFCSLRSATEMQRLPDPHFGNAALSLNSTESVESPVKLAAPITPLSPPDFAPDSRGANLELVRGGMERPAFLQIAGRRGPRGELRNWQEAACSSDKLERLRSQRKTNCVIRDYRAPRRRKLFLRPL